jgi:hypothetical protein
MRNPYEILEVPQDASNSQILKAMTVAMRKKVYSNTDIAHAKAQLSKPTQRLAADFTFPVFEAYDNMEPLVAAVHPEIIDINSISPEVYNSL